MFIRPGGVAAGFVYDPKDRVRPDEIPWIDRCAVLRRIANEPLRIDRSYSAVAGGCSPVQEVLLDVDSLLVLGSRAIRHVGCARPATDTVAGGLCGRGEHAVISHVVKGADGSRRAPTHQRHQS